MVDRKVSEAAGTAAEEEAAEAEEEAAEARAVALPLSCCLKS